MKKSYDSKTRLKIAQEYINGISSPVIADKYFVTPPTVRNYVREFGYSLRLKGNPKGENYKRRYYDTIIKAKYNLL